MNGGKEEEAKLRAVNQNPQKEFTVSGKQSCFSKSIINWVKIYIFFFFWVNEGEEKSTAKINIFN